MLFNIKSNDVKEGLNPNIRYEFHIARSIREKYDLEEELFSTDGKVIFANFPVVRKFVQKVNQKRKDSEKIKAGMVNAAGLIDEIYHYLFRKYEKEENRGVFSKAVNELAKNVGEENFHNFLIEFVNLFPPIEVYKGRMSAEDYLHSVSDGKPNREIVIEEMILLYFDNFNPANKLLKEFFDESYFVNQKLYQDIISRLDKFFQKEKPFGPENQDIFSFFRTPILHCPDDIDAQLDYVLKKWDVILEDEFKQRILRGKDLIKEDIALEGGGGGAPTIAPKYKGGMEGDESLRLGKSGYRYAYDAYLGVEEPEQFTEDIHWMPRVVLIAKNVYVWMDQLSKKYNREIKTLDQIPNEELDLFAKWNFTGLWLIGIWERNPASKRIKHIMGNIEAVSSAYSLYDYVIAEELGGEQAYHNLNKRANERGIRLASDMVPNHTGIYSKWIIEHPEYFIQTNEPPFPGYSFSGEDLSHDSRVQIRIEDGYYQHSDAAVVFQRIDNQTGEVRYIYHGNDGTQMPWNDTAQLNMLKSEVREAVIQKIMEVARKFSVIRFDAAMTLAKKHFQRLWFPQPGMGGDIPSRTDHSMTKSEFDKWFPKEFWREVVDRINDELPETLLLAEAFWLMEGYFVRTLGMHRVYNSAFMHMLMKEENQKYRVLIKNTLEFEPEILKRYVNFMSNPDEETAIKQFGTDDKYFGVAVAMITLPGLPMFAHGQIEGYTEKYGMEYKRAYYNEEPNQSLIERHEREIFPLMNKRYLFSQVDDFWFFDFIDDNNNVNENVFAYTNKHHNEKGLVLFNNKYDGTSGRITHSIQKTYGRNKNLASKSISDALGLNTSEHYYYVVHEHISGLEYLLNGRDLADNGFHTVLEGFKYKVYLNWREVYDNTGEYKKLYESLNGRGVESIWYAVEETRLQPLHNAFGNIFEEEIIAKFIDSQINLEKDKNNRLRFLHNRFYYFLNSVKDKFQITEPIKEIAEDYEATVESVGKLNEILEKDSPLKKNKVNNLIHKSIEVSKDGNYHENSILFLLWLSIFSLKKIFPDEGDVNKDNFIDRLILDKPVKEILSRLGKGESDLYYEVGLLKILLDYHSSIFDMRDLKEEFSELSDENKVKYYLEEYKGGKLIALLEDTMVQRFLGVNYYKGIWYYSKENFIDLVNWLMSISLIKLVKSYDHKITEQNRNELLELIEDANFLLNYLKKISEDSGYQVQMLKDLIRGGGSETSESTEG